MAGDLSSDNQLLLQRIRAGILLVLMSLAIFTIADIWVGRPGLWLGLLLKLAQVGIALAAYQATRWATTPRQVRVVALLSFALLCATNIAQGYVSQDALTTVLLLLLMAWGTATLFPWELWCQAVAVAIALTAIVCNGLLLQGRLFPFGTFPALGGMLALAGSLFVTVELRRYRREIAREIERRDRSEAEVRRQRDQLREVHQRKLAEERSALLLEFSHDIRGTYSLEELLARVQVRAAKMLGADAIVTHCWQEQEQSYRAISDHGLPSGLRAAVYQARFGAQEPFEGRLLRGETINLDDPAQAPPLLQDIASQFPITALIVAPLGVHGRHLGSLSALRIGAARPFSGDEADLCTGIAGQLAIAMETLQLQREQQDEASVSAALARVGHELISASDGRELVHRLCAVTAEVMSCELSYTVVQRPGEDVYRIVAAYGVAEEDWEAARVLTLPLDALTELLSDLERSPAVEVDTSAALTAWGEIPRHYGIRTVLYSALVRGAQIIGVHAAAYREPRQFSERQHRIAAGIAELASIGLEQARLVEETERASRLKSEFLATMSHELRTPLNVISGYTELMLDATFGALTPEQRQVIERIHASGRELIELVDATLDMSRLENGRVAIDVQAVDVRQLFRELEAETRGLQDRSDLTVRWEVAADLPDISTDRVKLKVVLKNLIGNALKFTPRGSVTIQAQRRDGGVQIQVHDTGIGIAPELLPIIFDAFRQGDNSFTRPYGGVGLGLYIVRRLLGLLRGTITVESEPGRGSVFTAWLPQAWEQHDTPDASSRQAVETSPARELARV